MQSVKENYTIGIGLIVVSYLMWRSFHLYYESIYDHILLNFILFSIWYIRFNYRSFVMTRKRLSSYYHANILEYKSLLVQGILKDVYVRVKGYEDWYKLDYSLTISKGCGYNIYEEFTSKNLTVKDLLSTMNKNADDLSIGNQYRIMKCNYTTFKYLSLSFFIIFEIFYWLIYNNVGIVY